MVLTSITAHAVNEGKESLRVNHKISTTFSIQFRFDKFNIDENYQNNKTQLEGIRQLALNKTPIDSIVIYSWASPEGSSAHNKWLARKRGAEIHKYLLNECGISADKINLDPQSENWSGLYSLVDSLYHRLDRERVISILKDDKIGDETRKWRLKQLDGGYTWDFLLRHYMPFLRSATWVCVWTKEEMLEPINVADYEIVASAQGLELESGVVQRMPANTIISTPEEKTMIFALRSNLLAPLLNVGVEVPIGNQWSVGADYYYPWAKRESDHMRCFQLLGLNLEGRYWFGQDRTKADRLRGHSMGVTLGGGYYDFERDYEGNQGEYISLGVDYLYAMPICKGKLHLEFSIGLGYAFSGMRPYEVLEPGGKAFKERYTKKNHWVGPTKAAVSLVVPIMKRVK